MVYRNHNVSCIEKKAKKLGVYQNIFIKIPLRNLNIHQKSFTLKNVLDVTIVGTPYIFLSYVYQTLKETINDDLCRSSVNKFILYQLNWNTYYRNIIIYKGNRRYRVRPWKYELTMKMTCSLSIQFFIWRTWHWMSPHTEYYEKRVQKCSNAF